MIRKIALEEHFILPEAAHYLVDAERQINETRVARIESLLPRLQDLGSARIELMDKSGIDTAVLSLTGPGAQGEPDTAKAQRFARECNDFLANTVAKSGGRYAGFAHLSMQDPEVASSELERCISDFKFEGCMINGHTLGSYLDDRKNDVFWSAVSQLKCPVYIHPRYAPEPPPYASSFAEISGALWGWMAETGGHALRLILGGTFDRHPDAKVILGHMGEALPFLVERLDIGWLKLPPEKRTRQKPSYYLKKNIWITTSGVPSTPALKCSLESLGESRVLFATDYPFEDCAAACQWFDNADVSESAREQVAYSNLASVLPRGLPL